jgi:hypothetical protein
MVQIIAIPPTLAATTMSTVMIAVFDFVDKLELVLFAAAFCWEVGVARAILVDVEVTCWTGVWATSWVGDEELEEELDLGGAEEEDDTGAEAETLRLDAEAEAETETELLAETDEETEDDDWAQVSGFKSRRGLSLQR